MSEISVAELLRQSPDNLAFALGIVLVLIGLFAPKKFLGIEIDWRPATSLASILLGVAFVVFSYPQMRAWRSNTVNVDRASLTKIREDLDLASKAAKAGRENSSDGPACSSRSGSALALLSTAIQKLDALTGSQQKP